MRYSSWLGPIDAPADTVRKSLEDLVAVRIARLADVEAMTAPAAAARMRTSTSCASNR